MATRGDIKPEERLDSSLQSFSGGMRRNVDASMLEENQYLYGKNLRVRDGYVIPTKSPTDLTNTLPEGLKQGIYGYDSILVVFNKGKAYGRDFSDPIGQFNEVFGFQMSEIVDRIYAQDVPASWMNFERKLSNGTDINSDITLLSTIAGTPAALICQDGINQPRLIFSIGNGRAAKTFEEWNNSNLEQQDTREYVPIGLQMMYHPDGILFIVSPDGKELYRSVTGRPLDFVIAIDPNGDKLEPLSSGKPEASRMAYNLDYQPITAIFNVNSTPRRDIEASGFFVSTSKRSWLVFPDYSQTPYNEPLFANQPIFGTGSLNQDSVWEALGQNGIITEAGPMTFDGIANTQTEGKNSPFYYQVAKLFSGVTQTTTCVGRFDDYTLFAVNTIYGYGILVYDNLAQIFVSFDQYSEITGVIKQFAEIKVNGVKRVFCITTEDELFELFSGNTAPWSLYTREASVGNSELELILRRVRVTLGNVPVGGILTVKEFVNRKPGQTRDRTIEANITSNSLPITPPFGDAKVDNITYTLEVPLKGEKVGVFISGDFDCELQRIQLVVEADEQPTTDEEKGRIHSNLRGDI